jgi:hypothetical protein
MPIIINNDWSYVVWSSSGGFVQMCHYMWPPHEALRKPFFLVIEVFEMKNILIAICEKFNVSKYIFLTKNPFEVENFVSECLIS